MNNQADERWLSWPVWSCLATQNPAPNPTGPGTVPPTTSVRHAVPGRDNDPMLDDHAHSSHSQ